MQRLSSSSQGGANTRVGVSTASSSTSSSSSSSAASCRQSTPFSASSSPAACLYASPSSFPPPDVCRRQLEDARDTSWRRRLRLKLQKKRRADEGNGQGGGAAAEAGGAAGTDGREKNIIRLQKLANRIKKITEAEKEALLFELGKLNVSLFLSEFADSICEVDFKISDVKAVVEVCVALHETYPEFLPLLKQSVQKQIKVMQADRAGECRRRLRFVFFPMP